MQTLEATHEALAAPRPLFRWRFRSIEALRRALEEYTATVDLELGPRREADGGDPDPTVQDFRYRIMAQNWEIDRRLVRLFSEAPVYARLLHWYYRKGCVCEADGWRVAAKHAGVPHRRRIYRGADMNRHRFEVLLDMALRELFHTH